MSKTTFETRGAQYELEIEIDTPRAEVWEALTAGVNNWWLPDFHMAGAGSVVTFDAQAGGLLVERVEGGRSLLWYTVMMVTPGESIYMTGHSFPEWGGPGTTLMKLALEDREGGCLLKLSDAHFGRASDEHIASMKEGWTWLFTDGLKMYCETGAT